MKTPRFDGRNDAAPAGWRGEPRVSLLALNLALDLQLPAPH